MGLFDTSYETITCPVCGQSVASNANVCPHCGHNFAKEKSNKAAKGLTIGCLIPLIVLLVLVLCLGMCMRP